MDTAQQPLVSCIMPTYNRRAFVSHAIRYFLRQEYPNKELIILDDGTDVVEDLIPVAENIRYFRLPQKISLGEKLNHACEYAKGDIIANWDDDDWYAPKRLCYQVEALQQPNIAVCGINQLLYYHLKTQRGYLYRYPADQRIWLLGSSLCFTKALWQRNKFAEIQVGMDGLFVWATPPEQVKALDNFYFSVHLIHADNVSPKDTENSWWHPHPVEALQKTMGKDWDYYKNGEVRPATKNGKHVETTPSVYFGYGISDFGTAEIRNPISEIVSPSVKIMKNVFACLVHEKEDCILDLVRNLHYHDPSSIILLYNGSENPHLIQNLLPFQAYNVVFHPQPKPQKHGYLHGFALDCMTYALENFSFDTFTIVDSDQLCIREGYSSFLSDYFAHAPNVGLLSSVPERVTPDHKTNTTALQAFREYDLWKPFLADFTEGDAKFVHWTFWPSTVFTFPALRDLVKLFAENKLLQHIMQNTKIWATEEVIFPTLVRLLGYEIAENPCSYAFVKYKQQFSPSDVDKALQLPNAFWIHPVERQLSHPIRQYLRQRTRQYVAQNKPIPITTLSFPSESFLKSMHPIEGWLSDSEATLLLAVTEKALSLLPEPHYIVEVGSYHGKSTVLMGNFVKTYFPKAIIHAIDPHDGKLGAADTGLQTFPPSFDMFQKNIAQAGLTKTVQTIKSTTAEVVWTQPISLLFIDGLHDYGHISSDFRHFSAWITEGGYVAFHDYADYFPGVKAFVHELLATGTYQKIQHVDSLMVLQKNSKITNTYNITKINNTNKIPNIIHQSWKDELIPYDIYNKKWIDSWQTQHPDWKRLFWTDEQNEKLVREFYPEFYDFYLSLTPNIKKADFCRFLYLHKFGGVYVDLDFVCLKNLSSLLDGYDIVLGRLSADNDYYQIPNAFMASRPELDFWLQTARDAMYAPSDEQTVEKHAGPFRLEWAVNKYKPRNVRIVESEIIYPFDWIHFTKWQNGKYFRQDLAQLAQDLQNKEINEMRAAFPNSFCLTFWTHNW